MPNDHNRNCQHHHHRNSKSAMAPQPAFEEEMVTTATGHDPYEYQIRH